MNATYRFSRLAARGSRLALGLTLISSLAAAQEVIYVDGGAMSSGTGTTDFLNAFQTLEEALDPAGPLSTFNSIEIRITEGTYVPDGSLSFGSTGVSREATFLVPDRVVSIRGSYDASDTGEEPTGAQTILSGDLGTQGDPGDNCFHTVVLEAAGQFDELELQDVVVRDGFADAPLATSTEAFGGGILAFGAKVRLTDVVVRDSFANFGGGIAGLRNMDGGKDFIVEMRARRLRVRNNTARIAGAGVYASGGMYSSFASCTFRANTGVTSGGAVFIDGSVVDFEAASSRFFDNSARQGGAVYTSLPASGGHRLLNCTVAYNTALDVGGGVYVEGGADVTGRRRQLHNSIFFENAGSSTVGQDNVFDAVSPLSAMYAPGDTVSYDHSFVGDADPGSFPIPTGEPVVDASAPSTLTPGWVNGPARNFRLVVGSVCIDRGSDVLLEQGDFADIDDDGDDGTSEPLPREFFMGDESFILNPDFTTREFLVGGAANTTIPGLIAGVPGGQSLTAICDIGAFEYRFAFTTPQL
ncbi:MAG: hypothetical protein AAGI22_03050 [Planctomycetota bacterium]